jgi:hypothetical protein
VLGRINRPEPGLITVRRTDARTLEIGEELASLVVTSPPYLGMIDYAKANRLTYMWMGWDLPEDKALEIGARYRRHATSAAERYFADMASCAQAIVTCISRGGYCALVIGASRKYPEAPQRVIDIFAKHLEVMWGPRERTPTRRRVGDRAGTEPKELLCVLKKAW